MERDTPNGPRGERGAWSKPRERDAHPCRGRPSNHPGRGGRAGSMRSATARYVAVAVRVGFAGSWSGAVGRLASWCWGGAWLVLGRFGGAGSWRLPASRRCTSPPGPGLCLVLRIRCCPSTTWPLLPWTALLARGRGRLCVGRRGVRPLRRRCDLVRGGRFPFGAWVCWLGLRLRVCEALGSPSACGPFCLVATRFGPGEHETGTHRPAQTRAPGKTAGHASRRALGVSSGSGFGPGEGAGVGMGCEMRHGRRLPGPQMPSESDTCVTRKISQCLEERRLRGLSPVDESEVEQDAAAVATLGF
ncbi:hypothetical protein ABIA38_003136 [Embleya sp. AB8]